jgi:hypothetical protein
MSKNVEIILEGTYQYFEKDVNFSHENFKLVHDKDEQAYHIYAEVLSRIETGEFLKILVRYEMNTQFLPKFVRIEKSIGNKYAEETFDLDATNLELTYSFKSSHMSQEFKRAISAKHYITSPAISTSAIFTLSKKFDATGRTPVIFVGSDNEWTYNGPPTEKMVYADYLSRDLPDFTLRGNPLSASLVGLYEFDASHAAQEDPVELYLSKHYNIPYKLHHGDLKVEISKLKKNS